MTAKEYLRQFRQLGFRIQTIREEIAAIEAERGALAISIDGLPHSSGISDRTGRLAARLADELGAMQEELVEINTDYWSKRQIIVKQINSLDDAVCVRILKLRYVGGYSWEEIAADMAYTVRYVLMLHGKALQDFAKKVNIP